MIRVGGPLGDGLPGHSTEDTGMDKRKIAGVSRRRRMTVMASIIGVLGMWVTGPSLAAASWPTRTVTLVVPFSAGGTTDIVARLLAQKLTALWGESVVVDDRPGAGGNIGSAIVAKAAPDGYTILVPSGSVLTVNPHLYRDMGFDVKKDLAAVTNVATGPMVVVVNPKVPAQTLQELIALAKAQPGTLNFGSAGQGSQVHMAGERFASAAGIQITHVPYKGEAVAYNDLVGGQIQVVVGNIAAASAFVNGGQLRALAVTSKERSKMLPNVPTASESGLSGLEMTGWFGLMVPAGTPKEVIDKIFADVATVLKDPDMQAKLAAQGMTPVANTPEQFTKQIADELQQWGTIVKTRNLQVH
jgi:tripartite-type tricarboxylate transporter receptor subunit TctC